MPPMLAVTGVCNRHRPAGRRVTSARRTTSSAAVAASPTATARRSVAAALRTAPTVSGSAWRASAGSSCITRRTAGSTTCIARWRATRSATCVPRRRTTRPATCIPRRRTARSATRVPRRRTARPATRMPRRRTARPAASMTRRRTAAVSGRRSAGWTTRAGSRRRRRRVMRPARLLAVPWPAAIIVAPVSADRERDDRQADHRAVVHQGHVAALVGIVEPRGIDPAAQIRRCDIAPLIVAETAHHGERHAAGNLDDDGIIGGRPRPHIHRAVRVSLRLRIGRNRQRDQTGSDANTASELLHSSPVAFHGF